MIADDCGLLRKRAVIDLVDLLDLVFFEFPLDLDEVLARRVALVERELAAIDRETAANNALFIDEPLPLF